MQPFVGRELFAAGFVSCWAKLTETSQKQLVRSMEMAFSSPNIPPEILATLLNLVCSSIWIFFSSSFNGRPCKILLSMSNDYNIFYEIMYTALAVSKSGEETMNVFHIFFLIDSRDVLHCGV